MGRVPPFMPIAAESTVSGAGIGRLPAKAEVQTLGCTVPNRPLGTLVTVREVLRNARAWTKVQLPPPNPGKLICIDNRVLGRSTLGLFGFTGSA